MPLTIHAHRTFVGEDKAPRKLRTEAALAIHEEYTTIGRTTHLPAIETLVHLPVVPCQTHARRLLEQLL